MFATDLLKHDHRELMELFTRIETESPEDSRRLLYEEARNRFLAHARMEEEIFYVAVRETARGAKSLIEQAQGQHHEVEALLRDLDKLETYQEEFDDLFHELKDNVEAHIEMEESQIFAEAYRSIDDAELERMAEDMQRIKDRFLAAVEPIVAEARQELHLDGGS